MTLRENTLNERLYARLGILVHSGGTFDVNGVWLKAFVRDGRDLPVVPPDFSGSVDASLSYVPKDVQATRHWSTYTGEVVWLLMRRDGSFLVEGRAAEDAEALALALLGLLERIGVTP